jgi:hypothetical protein
MRRAARVLALLAILLLLATPAHAAALLRLSASTARSEFTAGDSFTVVAYLFNDGDATANATLSIAPAAGFEAIGERVESGPIAPGRALGAQWSYRVLPSTPKGLARFVVTGGGLTQTVTIRVGPIEWPAPPRPPLHRLYFPLFL